MEKPSARNEEANKKFQELRAALQKPVRIKLDENANIPHSHLIGSAPKPSDQQQKQSCYAHAVGKALVEFIDCHGLDCDQDTIIEDLEKIVGTGRQRYEAFNNKTLTVRVVIKGRPDQFDYFPIRILSEIDYNPM